MEFFSRQGSLVAQSDLASADLIKGTGTYRFIDYCGRCGGSGYLAAYVRINGGLCFKCNGNAKWGAIGKCYSADKLAKLNATAQTKFKRKIAASEARAALYHETFVKPFLAEYGNLIDEAEQTLEVKENSFVRSMIATLRQTGKATERQVEVLTTHIERARADALNVSEVPQGKIEIEGEVLFVKVETVHYYPMTTSYKMLIMCDGFKLWGSIPKKVLDSVVESLDELKGKRVAFTATVEQKKPGFGFYKRPTKARIM